MNGTRRAFALRDGATRFYECSSAPRLKVAVLPFMVCLGCLVGGVVLASLALRDPERAGVFERWSGICLVLGLCMLGFALRNAR